MKCPHCNADVDDRISTCRSCGGNLRAEPSDRKTEKRRPSVGDEVRAIIADYLPKKNVNKSALTPDNPLGGDMTEAPHTYAAKMYQALFQRNVTVHTPFGAGSGFFLPNGYIATNAHVITDRNRNVSKTVFVCHLERKYPAQVVVADINQDTALVRIIGEQPANVKECYNAIGNSHELLPGDELISIGNSLGLGLSYNRFNVKQTVGHKPFMPRYRELILLNATAQHGNSGGAIYNAKGEVVGLLTGSPMTGETVFVHGENNSWIPIEVLGPEPGVAIGVTIETLMMLTKYIQ